MTDPNTPHATSLPAAKPALRKTLLTEAEQDARLLEMAIERDFVTGRKRCSHAEATLCRHTDFCEEIGAYTFVAWQCDRCGSVIRRDVSADEMETPNLPPVDVELWGEAIRVANGVRLETTLAFWQKAIRR